MHGYQISSRPNTGSHHAWKGSKDRHTADGIDWFSGMSNKKYEMPNIECLMQSIPTYFVPMQEAGVQQNLQTPS